MPKTKPTPPPPKSLTDAEQAAVQRLIRSDNLYTIAKRLGVAAPTLARIALGAEGHPGTLVMIRNGLAEVGKAS